MAGGGGNADGDVGFQIAPMIDLILVLMVYFMATVALKVVENELGIQLPGTSTGNSDAAEKVELNIGIDVDGSVTVNTENVADPKDKQLKGLRARLQNQIKLFTDKCPVIIVPQGAVKHARVIDVLNACSAEKVKNISFGGG